MSLTSHPRGQDTTAMLTQAPHCPQFKLSVLANFLRIMVIPMMARNSLFLYIPSKMFFFSSFLALNSLNTWHNTKVLNNNISFTLLSTPNIASHLNCKVTRTAIWYRAWAIKFLHMILVISGSVLPTGLFFINSFVYIIFLQFGHLLIMPSGTSCLACSEGIEAYFFFFTKKSFNKKEPPHTFNGIAFST